jgi:hypothetical protein
MPIHWPLPLLNIVASPLTPIGIFATSDFIISDAQKAAVA